MSLEVSERSFEEAIECGLLQHGPDACAATRRRSARRRRLWRHAARRLPQAHARGLRPRALPAAARRGRLRARHAAQGMGEARAAPRRGGQASSFSSASPPRSSGAARSTCCATASRTPAASSSSPTSARRAGSTRRRGGCTRQTCSRVVRQLRYSAKNENSLDLVLFLNGIPIFTAELKNPLTGQDVEDAITPVQDRPRPARAAPRLRPLPRALRGRPGPGLRHDRTSPGAKTRFLPFNQGKFGGAGNPPVPPTRKGYATATCGRRPGRATACSTSCASSSTRSRRRTTRAARPASAS